MGTRQSRVNKRKNTSDLKVEHLFLTIRNIRVGLDILYLYIVYIGAKCEYILGIYFKKDIVQMKLKFFYATTTHDFNAKAKQP